MRRLATAGIVAALFAAPAAEARKPIIADVDPATDRLRLYDAELGRDVRAPAITIPGPVRRFSTSLDGRYIVYVDGNRRIHLFDRSTARERALPGIDVYSDPGEIPGGLAVSNTGRIAFDNNGNGPALVYDAVAGRFVETGLPPDNGHRQNHLSGDGRFLATTCVTGAMRCAAESGGTDADLFVQDLTTRLDTGFPDNVRGADRDEEHPCIDGDGSLVGADVGQPVQRDVFIYDRGAGAELQLPGLNEPAAADVNCVLDAAGDYIGLDDNAGNFRLYERATSSRVALPPGRISPPAWFSSPFAPPGACANRIRGTSRRDRLNGTAGGDRIRGLAGDDVLNGLDGDDCLEGGAGGDRLTGSRGRNRLSGGAGNDTLTGGADNDRLTGGPGRNTYRAGAGNDQVLAANGSRDAVDCGPGRDTARADRTDRLRGCERVRRSG